MRQKRGVLTPGGTIADMTHMRVGRAPARKARGANFIL